MSALALALLLVAGEGPLVAVSGPSAFGDCTLDEVLQQRGRVFMGSEVEPRLAVNPQDPANVVATFQQDRWSNGGSRGLVAGVSLDGGATWRSLAIPGLSLCSGGTYHRATDPWLSFAPNGDLYHIGLALDVDFSITLPPGVRPPRLEALGNANALFVSKSTDGGLSWQGPFSIIEDIGGPLDDKETITADPTDAASRLVYATWDRYEPLAGGHVRAPALFARTTDGGETWEPARVIYDPGADNGTVGNQILVLPDGTLLDLFSEYRAVRGPRGISGYENFLSVIRSADKGRTWEGPDGLPLRAFPLVLGHVVDPRTRAPVRSGDGLVDVAVDPRSGALYAAWEDSRFDVDVDLGFRESILFSTSADGGFTWSGPVAIANGAPRSGVLDDQAFTPTIRVAANGTVGVSYYEFQHGQATSALTDHWLVRCAARPAALCARAEAWGPAQRLTDAPFDLEKAPVARGFFLGDYEGLATAGDEFLALFAKTQPADPASIFFRRVR